MEFRVLGSVELRGAAGQVKLGRAKERSLLGVLTLSSGKPVGVRTLLQALWDDWPPARARKDLQIYVSRLRGYLREAGASARIVTQHNSYIFQPENDVVDYLRFKTLLKAGRDAQHDGDLDEAAARLHEAVSLWLGPPIADLDTIWMEQRREDLENYDQVAGYQALCDVELERGNYREVLQFLDDVIQGHELDTKYISQRLAALDGCGHYADFDAYWRQIYRRTVESFGTGPSRELQNLHSRLLQTRDDLVPLKKARSRAPAQLPPAVGEFTGRQNHVATLDMLLTRTTVDEPSSSLIVAITGPAGVGKTELGLQWAHLIRKQFAHAQLFADLGGYSSGGPVDPASVLADFLSTFGIASTELPTTVTGRSALFRTVLDGQRALIFLDNAKDSDQLRPLLPGSAGGCVVIVTSRHWLTDLVRRQGAHRVTLQPLDKSQTDALLHQLLGNSGKDLDSATFATLNARSAGLPQAIRILADLVAVERDTQLRSTYSDQLPTVVDLLHAGESEQQTLYASLLSSYLALSEGAARTLRLLGLHPGPDFTVHVSAALGDRTFHQSQRDVDELKALNLVNSNSNRFVFQPLVHTFATECLSTTGQPRDHVLALTREVNWYLQAVEAARDTISPSGAAIASRDLDAETSGVTMTFPRPATAAQWLTVERENIAAVVRASARADLPHSWQLVHALSGCGTAWSDPPPDWSDVLTTALVATRKAGDLSGEGDVLNAIALSCGRTDDKENELNNLYLALTLFRTINNRRGECESLMFLGDHKRRQGDSTAAATYYEESLTTLGDTVEPNLRALIHYRMGVTHADLSMFEKSAASLRQALAIYTNLSNEIYQVKILSQLGLVSRQAGRNHEAAALLEEAVALNAEGVAEHDDMISSLVNLSELYQAAEDTDKVVTRAREAIGLCHAGKDYDYIVRAQVALVQALCQTSRLDEARREAKKTLELIEDTQRPRSDDIRKKFEALGVI